MRGARAISTSGSALYARAPWAAVLLIIGVFVTPGGSAAEPSIRLRYGLQPGAAYDQTTTLNLVMQLKTEGLPEAAAQLAQAVAKDNKQDLKIQVRVEVGPKGADGSLPLTYRLVDAKGTLTMGGQTKDLLGSSQSETGATLHGHLSSDGRTVDLEAGPEDAAHPMSAGVKERVVQSLPTLPDRDLGIGDHFEIPGGLDLPGLPGGAQRQIDAQCVMTLKSLSNTEAVFDVRQIMSVSPGTTPPGGRTLAISGGGTGTATYDRREGLFASVQLQIEVEVTMGTGASAAASDPRLKQLPQGVVAGPITMKAVVRGPMAITMARAVAAR